MAVKPNPSLVKALLFVRQKWWVAALGVALALCVFVATRESRDFYLGSRKISVAIESLAPNDPFYDEGRVVNVGWDGPTGEFTSGKIYGIKLGKRMVRVDVVHDPIGAIRRDLPKTVPELITRLLAKNFYVRRCAAEALIAMGAQAESAMPSFLQRVRSGDVAFQDETVKLAGAAGAAVVPHLLVGLRDARAPVRKTCAEALGEIGFRATNAIPLLSEALRDADPNVVVSSAVSLRKIEKRHQGEVAALRGLIAHEDRAVRVAALYALADFEEDAAAAVVELIEVLEDKDDELAGLAARAFGAIGPKARTGIPNLIALLDSTNIITVMFAMDALAEFGEEAAAAVPELRRLAREEGHSVKALAALATMGEPGIAAVIEIYREPATGGYFAAKPLMALGERAAAAVPFLREELRSSKPRRVALAAMTLGRIGEPAQIAILDLREALKKSDDLHMQLRVAEALWRLDRATNAVLPVMLRQLDHWSSQPNALRSRSTDTYAESRTDIAVRVVGEIGPAAIKAAPYLRSMRGSSFEETRVLAEQALASISAQ